MKKILSVLLIGLFLSLFISCKKEDNQAPTVTVVTVSNISESTASSGGQVTSDGGSAVTARGVCWGKSQDPTIADKKTSDGTGSGSFTSSLTGLEPGVTYNIRAYATNAIGTGYSSQSSFSSLSTVPVLTTLAISEMTATSVNSGGNITSDGGAAVTARGVCWNTATSPTINNSKTTDGAGIGNYPSAITGLTPNTTYYIRAYATNSKGTAYGDEIILKTYTGVVTDSEGNIYNTVTIGSQLWMAKNLRVTKYSDGASIPIVTDQSTWNSTLLPGFCWYNNDETNKNTYGTLYNWYAVNASGKNICPAGWHVPSDGEWSTLTTFLNGENGAGGKLKETGLTHWNSPNTGATNETGFTALGAGSRGSTFFGIGTDADFWTSTEYNGGSSWNRFISSSNNNVHKLFSGKQNGFSIRCVKD
jgi:uncharacterized protein (TIGR02145 family)